jgi:LmbE family N-acetylglucosaminyl deacetylase
MRLRGRPASLWVLLLALIRVSLSYSQQAPPYPGPDARYKVDILVIVAHPDDDIEVAAYLAKLIEQQRKHVAVIYTTRGNSGGNFAGPEQASALAEVREMEARQSLAIYGITNAWFLRGSDTPGVDVLHSLEAWGHGRTLDEVVRLVRLTRPEVILTWLPDYVVGENHEDHQAAGVIATASTSPTTEKGFVLGSRKRFIIFPTLFTSTFSKTEDRSIRPVTSRRKEKFRIPRSQPKPGTTTKPKMISPRPK